MTLSPFIHIFSFQMARTLTSRPDADRSINQLLCLIMGGHIARNTSNLSIDPQKRIDACVSLIAEEMNRAVKDQNTDLEKVMVSAQRKISSLQSLRTLNSLILEVDWT